MNTSHPTFLTSFMINGTCQTELHDEHLTQSDYQKFHLVLPPCGGARIHLGQPPLELELAWARQRADAPVQFDIYRDDAILLIAGLALDSRESTRLRGWFNLLQGATFRCLQNPEILWPKPPWLGLLLMPDALDLSNIQLDALCGLAQRMGQVWLRRHLTAAAPLQPQY